MQTKAPIRTRPGDRQVMDIPDLKQNSANLRIIVAAMNGVIEKDEVAEGETFIVYCVKKIFKKRMA